MKNSAAIRPHQLWLGVASVAVVLWLLVQQVDHVSPGPLSAAHLQESGLGERGTCRRCHGGGELTLAQACVGCHATVAEEMRSASGFHGTLGGVDVQDCGHCHAEHAGEDFQLVDRRSFALAGFATRDEYDHSELDFELKGRHATLSCVACHANADLLLLPKGSTRFAGLDQGCQSCHEDAHQGRIVRACAACHGQEHPFQLVASFEHDSFASACAHGAVSCQECHPKNSSFDSEVLAGADPPDCRRQCQDCHVSPHSPEFTAGVAALAGVPEGASCEQCHSEAHGTFAGHPEASPPALHAASGFALDEPHNGVACAGCHAEVVGDEVVPFAEHFPPRSADDCRVCHGDPHMGQFSGGPFGEGGCLQCHARQHFEPSDFKLEQHARTEFPLVASHEAVACSSCHEPPASGEPRLFRGRDRACSACHQDAHRGAFAPEPPRAAARGCEECHEPTLFSKYDEQAFDHGQRTHFALEGAHARAKCEACHERRAAPDDTGRTFGVIAEVFGEPAERCSTCHVDAHAGRFDHAELPAAVDGRTDCARCHSSETFAEPRDASFEHERWTGYPMAEFHARVQCVECHVPAALPDESGRTFGRAPRRCQDCHADPHVGQFVVAGANDCARCHLDAGGLAFDHQRDSRYALDEIHVDLECAACHVPWPVPGGGEAVRYKPLGTECVDCHDPDFLERNRKGSTKRRGERRGITPKGGER